MAGQPQQPDSEASYSTMSSNAINNQAGSDHSPSYSSLNNQPEPRSSNAFGGLNPTTAAGMASLAQSHGFPASSCALSLKMGQQGQLMESLTSSSGSQLPDHTPLGPQDPLEQAMLADYLKMVATLRGDHAAAAAAATAGRTAAASQYHNSPADFSQLFSSTEPTSAKASSTNATPDDDSSAASGSGGGGAPKADQRGSTSRGAGSPEKQMMGNILTFIRGRKLAGMRALQQQQQARATNSTALNNGTGGGGAMQLVTQPAQQGAGRQNASSVKIWIQPSGPRQPGQGIEDDEQGILSAEEVPSTGDVMLRITLLAAGFVIGPSGASVREVMRQTGADIKSWTEQGSHRSKRPARVFLISGDPQNMAQAIYIISSAVDRYKELCEGRYKGQAVSRGQQVLGVEFFYQPPPKSVVPSAASLRGTHPLTYKQHAQNGPASSSSSGVGATYRAEPAPHLQHMEAMAAAWMAAYTAAMMPGSSMFGGLMPGAGAGMAGGGYPGMAAAAATAAAAAAGMGPVGGIDTFGMPGMFPYDAGVAGGAGGMFQPGMLPPGGAPFAGLAGAGLGDAASMLGGFPGVGLGGLDGSNSPLMEELGAGEGSVQRTASGGTPSSSNPAGDAWAESLHSGTSSHTGATQAQVGTQARPETPPRAPAQQQAGQAASHGSSSRGGGAPGRSQAGNAGVWGAGLPMLGIPAGPMMPGMGSPTGAMPPYPMSPGVAPWLVPGSPGHAHAPLIGHLPGMPPYAPVPASPMRVLKLQQGNPVPVVEVGGCTYFPAPPSPGMPPGLPPSPMGIPSPGGHMMGPAPDPWRLLHDNPYLTQHAIGAKQPPPPPPQPGPRGGSGNGGSGRAYHNTSSPRRAGPAPPPPARPRQAGSSSAPGAPNSSRGATGAAAVGSNQQAEADQATSADPLPTPAFDQKAVIAALSPPAAKPALEPSNFSEAHKQQAAGMGTEDSRHSDPQHRSDQGSMEEGQGGASNHGSSKASLFRAKAGLGLQTIPEAGTTEASDAYTPDQTREAPGSPVGRGYRHGAHQQQLNASSDPIVSPGRITLACKVKASGLTIPASLLGRPSQRPEPQDLPTTTSAGANGSAAGSQSGGRPAGEDVAAAGEVATEGAGPGATQVAAE